MPRPELEALAAKLATELARVCPKTPYDDIASFKTCAAALKHQTFVPFGQDVLWGGDQTNLPIKKRHMTHFNPAVFQSMYLPLMTFTGKWSIGHDTIENMDTIQLESYFRNALPAGEYPYPFWHSADKWNAYETMNTMTFYLNDKGKIFVSTRGSGGSNDSKGPYTHVAHETFQKDHWMWTDGHGKPQPEVSLFSARYQAGNPHLRKLDQAYRGFATEMRKASCAGCHNPSNPADADALTLLQTPNHAAGEIDHVIAQIEKRKMPLDDIGLPKAIDPKLRAAILRTAKTFKAELVLADAWEAKKGAVAAASPSGTRTR